MTAGFRRLPLAEVLVALLCLGISACGSSASRPTQLAGTVADAPTPPRAYLNDGDEDPSSDEDEDDLNGKTKDQDNDYPADHLKVKNGSYHDEDDNPIVAFGHRADSSDEAQIRTLAERYYQAASSADGATGCSLLIPTLAKSIPGDYGKSPGPEYLRGNTCPAVLTKIFKHSREQLTERFSVTEARVHGKHGIALLGSENKPASYIMVERAPSGWRVIGLVPTVLP